MLFRSSVNGTILVPMVEGERKEPTCTAQALTSRWYQNDHFILSSQAKQVFYLHDTKLGGPWQVVQYIQHRGMFDVLEVGMENPMTIHKLMMQSNKKQLLMLSLSMLKIMFNIVWVMLNLRLFLKVKL